MTPVASFSLDPLPGSAPDDADRSRSRLRYDDRLVGEVEGLAIDRQYRMAGGEYVIIADYDCPFEEALAISLLDAKFRTLDLRVIGGMYTTGSLRDVTIEGERTLRFSFFADDLWELEVLPRARWMPSTDLALAGWINPHGLVTQFGTERRSLRSCRLRLKRFVSSY